MDPRRLFESELVLIEDVIRFIRHRHQLSPDETEEFSSWVKLRLIDNDYGILRRFQHRSTLRTYLTTVIHRLFLDYRVQKWGKWRNSAKARALGPTAVALENLLYRDGYLLSEAIEILRTNCGVADSRDQLEMIATRLPHRVRRRMEGADEIHRLASDADGPEREVERAQHRSLMKKTQRLLQDALRDLPGEDRLILKMRYQDGVETTAIAAALNLERKPLYRRVDRLLAGLRKTLTEKGLSISDVSELIDGTPWDLELDYEGGNDVITSV